VDDQTTDKSKNQTAAASESIAEPSSRPRLKPALLETTSPDARGFSDTPGTAPLTAALTKDRPVAHKLNQPLGYALGAIVVLALGFGGGWLGAASHNDPTGSTANTLSLHDAQ
jgi:hypothetical protein